jgi:hypothetical protein
MEEDDDKAEGKSAGPKIVLGCLVGPALGQYRHRQLKAPNRLAKKPSATYNSTYEDFL